MKITLLMTIVSFFILNGFSQTQEILSHNNVAACMNTSSTFFQRDSTHNMGYLAPKDTCTSVINGGFFWFGTEDINDNFHLAANRFNDNGETDFFVGPIADNYNTTNYQNTYNHIWKVSKFEINQHRQNFDDPGYIIPDNILTWPGNGDISNGEAAQLAPYVDDNNNGIYDPLNGDYPNIRGHQSMYMIVNDAAGSHTSSGGDPLGMEFHYMLYQYATNDYLDNTTFINIRVFNRSTTTYSNFKMCSYLDPDIGGFADDFAGIDFDRNMIYTFNADNNDDIGIYNCEYGENPPAMGIKLLNHNTTPRDSSDYGGPSQVTYPTIADEIWAVMSKTFNHASGSNIPVDVRTSITADSTNTFLPGESVCYDLAILYARIGNYLENANYLSVLADSIQTFFDDQTQFSCDPVVLNVNHANMPNHALNLYPNPSEGSFKVDLTGTFKVTLYSISGQVVLVKDNVTAQTSIDIDLSKGIYSVKVTQNNSDYYQKLIFR